MRRAPGSRAVAAILVGALVLGTSGARQALGQTQGGSVVASGDAAEAARLLGEGMAASNAGEWEKARDLFERAYTLRNHWKIAANLGRAEVKLGRSRDAAEHLEYFLRNAGPNDVAPEDREETERLLNEVRLKVATIAVIVDVRGAEVLVDGKVAGVSPLKERLFLNPGERVIEARHEGYELQRRSLDLRAGMSENVEFVMNPIHSRATPGVTGRGKVQHDVELEHDTAIYTPPVYPDVPGEMPGWKKASLGVGFGLGALSAGAGVVFLALGYAKNSQATDEGIALDRITDGDTERCDSVRQNVEAKRKEMCEKLTILIENRDMFRDIGRVGLAVGGVLTGAAVAVVLIPSGSETRKANLQIVPMVSTTGGIMGLKGVF